MDCSEGQNLKGILKSTKKSVKKNPFNTELCKEYESKVVKWTQWELSVELPDEFNGSKVWDNYFPVIPSQGECGSCWAFATTFVLGSRLRIWSKLKIIALLDHFNILLCTSDKDIWKFNFDSVSSIDTLRIRELQKNINEEYGCRGSSLENAWKHLLLIGTCNKDCVSNVLELQNIAEKGSEFTQNTFCSSSFGPYIDICNPNIDSVDIDSRRSGYPLRHYRCKAVYRCENEKDIMRDIFINGPTCSALKMYADFYDFDHTTDEVYTHQSDESDGILGGHAISIIGWGTNKKGVKYWWVRNSWGKEFGVDGNFKIERGKDICGIESSVVTAIPDLFYQIGQIPTRIKSYIDFTPENWQKDRISINVGVAVSPQHIGEYLVAGGLDTVTGYSRRVLMSYPFSTTSVWGNETPVVPSDNFIAGEVSTKNIIEEYNKNETNKCFNNLWIIFVLTILFGILIIKLISPLRK